MKTGILIIIGVLAVGLTLVSCDGETVILTSTVETDSTEVWVVGTVVMRPWIDFHLNMLKIHAQENQVDSVKFADSLCRIGAGSFHVWGDDYYYGAYYYNPDDGARFASGDSVQIELYSDLGTTTAKIKLLVAPGDSVMFVESASDTIADIGEVINITWDIIPNADWYGIDYGFWFDSSDGHSYPLCDSLVATTDTAIQLPGGPRIGGYGLNVFAYTGPVPGTGDYNVSGPGVVGTIYSSGRHAYWNVAVGHPDPGPASSRPGGDKYAAPDRDFIEALQQR